MEETVEKKIFSIGMKWRIGYGFLRILFGLALLKFVGTPLIEVVTTLMGHELSQDPSDILYTLITNLLTNHPLYVTHFLALYFIFWGMLDIALSYNLIKHKLWAFPASFVLIGLFVMYETIRFTHTHSLILLSVIFLDAIILWFIWREYRRLRVTAM